MARKGERETSLYKAKFDEGLLHFKIGATKALFYIRRILHEIQILFNHSSSHSKAFMGRFFSAWFVTPSGPGALFWATSAIQPAALEQ